MAFWFIDSYAELSSTGNAVRHTEEPPTTHVEENAGQVRLESFKCDALTNSVAGKRKSSLKSEGGCFSWRWSHQAHLRRHFHRAGVPA